MNKKYTVKTTFLALLVLPGVSWAQIVYQPAAAASTAIPTLTTTALFLVIVLLIAAAKWTGFNRNKNVGKIVGMLVVCAVVSGTFSVKLISEAYADGGGGTNFSFLNSASGGSVPITNGVLNIFENTSGTSQRIISVNPGACPDVDRGSIEGVSRCATNAVIGTDKNGLCYTECRAGG